MSAWFELAQYLRHRVKASGAHGIHSPYVFRLITKVLPPNQGVRDALRTIERRRSQLKNSNEAIEVQDFGAGPRSGIRGRRRISQIVRSASSSPQQLQALFQLVRDAQPKTIIELGSNLGLGTVALGLAAPEAVIWSTEGDPHLAEMARQFAEEVGISNVRIITSTFLDFLNEYPATNPPPDVAIIDGDHRKGPTLDYVNRLASLMNPGGLIILDDIHWSREMHNAWNELVADDRFGTTMDFFHFGVLVVHTPLRKQHFRLRLPV